MIGRLARLGTEHFESSFVDVAIRPVLAWLVGADDGVMRSFEVPRGMSPGRVVAAANVAARQAEPEMNPDTAILQTFHTSLPARRDAVRSMLCLVEMLARFGHGPPGL
jgi:hypothetical protein